MKEQTSRVFRSYQSSALIWINPRPMKIGNRRPKSAGKTGFERRGTGEVSNTVTGQVIAVEYKL